MFVTCLLRVGEDLELLISGAGVGVLVELGAIGRIAAGDFKGEAALFVEDLGDAAAEVVDGPLVGAVAGVSGLDDKSAGGGGSAEDGKGFSGVDVFDFEVASADVDELPFGVGGVGEIELLDDRCAVRGGGSLDNDGTVVVMGEDFVIAGEALVADVDESGGAEAFLELFEVEGGGLDESAEVLDFAEGAVGVAGFHGTYAADGPIVLWREEGVAGFADGDLRRLAIPQDGETLCPSLAGTVVAAIFHGDDAVVVIGGGHDHAVEEDAGGPALVGARVAPARAGGGAVEEDVGAGGEALCDDEMVAEAVGRGALGTERELTGECVGGGGIGGSEGGGILEIAVSDGAELAAAAEGEAVAIAVNVDVAHPAVFGVVEVDGEGVEFVGGDVGEGAFEGEAFDAGLLDAAGVGEGPHAAGEAVGGGFNGVAERNVDSDSGAVDGGDSAFEGEAAAGGPGVGEVGGYHLDVGDPALDGGAVDDDVGADVKAGGGSDVEGFSAAGDVGVGDVDGGAGFGSAAGALHGDEGSCGAGGLDDSGGGCGAAEDNAGTGDGESSGAGIGAGVEEDSAAETAGVLGQGGDGVDGVLDVGGVIAGNGRDGFGDGKCGDGLEAAFVAGVGEVGDVVAEGIGGVDEAGGAHGEGRGGSAGEWYRNIKSERNECAQGNSSFHKRLLPRRYCPPRWEREKRMVRVYPKFFDMMRYFDKYREE